MKKQKSTTKSSRQPSYLEIRFLEQWAEIAKDTKLSTLEAEVKIPPRRYRWDYRIPGTNVLIEINGGTYGKKRMSHSSGEGIGRGYEKSNYAQYKGWQQFTFDAKQVTPHKLQELFEYVCKRYPDRI